MGGDAFCPNSPLGAVRSKLGKALGSLKIKTGIAAKTFNRRRQSAS
jgi:hypothetical protein